MLKRLAYPTTGAALLLLTAVVFWYFNCLNILTLTQQQIQHQITQWRDQPQPDSDYHELKVTVKNTADRTGALARQFNNTASVQAGRLRPITERLRVLEGQTQTLSANYQHLQQQTVTCSRAKARRLVPSLLRVAKAPSSLTSNEFRAGRQFAAIAPSGYRSLSQLRLVAPGNSMQGWQLLQLDDSYTSFRGGGQRLMLSAGG